MLITHMDQLPVLILGVGERLQQQVSDLLRWVQTMELRSLPSLQPADTWRVRDEERMNDEFCVFQICRPSISEL